MTMLLKVTQVARPSARYQVSEAGDRTAPTVLFIHGYPDSQEVWCPLMERLSADYHVVSFDLPGVGGSVALRPSFKIDDLVQDFESIIDHVAGPAGRVHLVGHDWGSVLGWGCIDSELRHRIISYTSISGPHLGLYFRFLRSSGRFFQPRLQLRALVQAFASMYVLVLATPWLPEFVFRRFGQRVWRLVMHLGGVPKGDPMLLASKMNVLRMTIPTLELYRQNLRAVPAVPAPGSLTTPTLLVTPTLDPFITPFIFHDLQDFVPNLRVRRLRAGHWAQRSHPDQLAEWISAHVSDHDSHACPTISKRANR